VKRNKRTEQGGAKEDWRRDGGGRIKRKSMSWKKKSQDLFKRPRNAELILQNKKGAIETQGLNMKGTRTIEGRKKETLKKAREEARRMWERGKRT